MSIQESRYKLKRHGFVLYGVGGFKHDVYNKETGEKIKAAANPDELSRFANEIERNKKLERLQFTTPPVQQQPTSERRVWKLS